MSDYHSLLDDTPLDAERLAPPETGDVKQALATCAVVQVAFVLVTLGLLWLAGLLLG